ncbi:FkbM family methyltransferase [Halorussus ruber]|uniref:FkbM family methyltransferase n=1 Tax=Halorussus ruber TaxID=1126238 RepID=UPI001092B8F1|nr:FkbM family methyltransferase [Halorussus ruber]
MNSIQTKEVSFETPIGEVAMQISRDSDGLLASKTETFGGYEPGLVHTLAAVLEPDDVLYDIGAGFGYNGTVARSVSVPQENLHLFEIDEQRAEICSENHPEATLNRSPVGDGDGETIAIDSYTRSNPAPDVVTIDIEGLEVRALQGLRRTVATENPIVFVEVHPAFLSHFDAEVEEIHEILEENDYDVLVGNHRTYPMEWCRRKGDPPISRQAEIPTYTIFARPE